MLGNILPNLVIELDDGVHGNRHCNRLDAHDPDMGKDGVKRLETVSTKHLCDHSRNRHEDANEAVLEDTSPDHLNTSVSLASRAAREKADIEPGQAAPRLPPDPVLPSATFLKPRYRP